MQPPRTLSVGLSELLRETDEELHEYQCLGVFDAETQDRLRRAFMPERLSDTLNIEGIHVHPRVTLAVMDGAALAQVDRYAEREISNVLRAHDKVANSSPETGD